MFLEVALLRGVNDGLEHAAQLAQLLEPFARGDVLVNLIPCAGVGLRAARARLHPLLFLSASEREYLISN